MQIKVTTKEKFHVIRVQEPTLSATMAGELADYLLSYLQNDSYQSEKPVKNLVVVLTDTKSMDIAAAEKLIYVQQKFYENGASFVICELQKPVEEFLDQNELLEMMNVTPTESEAWDIVHMEEIEREMFGDEGTA